MTGSVVTKTWEERFWQKVALPNERGCMLWLASRTSSGYGQFFNSPFTTKVAHRISYLMAHGQIPAGLELDHLFTRYCPQGHPYGGDNLLINSRGGRECRECHNARGRERYSREEAATPFCVAGHGPKASRSDGRPYCPTCQRERRVGIRPGDPARPLIPAEDGAA